MRKTATAFFANLLLLSFVAKAQFSYISPLPGSKYHQPETNLILKSGQLIDKATVNMKNLLEINGSISGTHAYKAALSDDGKTVLIRPIPAFAYGESVTVTVASVLKTIQGKTIDGTSFSFETRNKFSAAEKAQIEQGRLDDFIASFGYDPKAKKENGFFQTPDSFPTFTINVNNNASPGQIFYCNQQELNPDDNNSFPTIIENDGTLVFARDEMKSGHAFQLNHNGYLSFYQYANNWWKILDSNYNEIDSVRCGNGYELETNGHDFQMYPDGHYYLLAFDDQIIDMTAYGGSPHANVTGLIVQELDANKNVIFQWRSWDHFLFTDANDYTPLTNVKVDYVHGNTVERDFDGNILISCRNMDEITKINSQTGDIIWRMGGENNQFTFVDDNIPEHFHQQHDVRRLPNGHITIFNNGNFLPTEVSSAKEYQLDEVNKVATLIWFYEHPDVNGKKVFARASGNAQRLPNGNTMISWGTILFNLGLPNMTEVDMNKNIVWEMTFDEAGQKSYRTFKFNWNPCSRVSGFTMKATKKPGKMILSWQPATGAIGYQVSYRKVGSMNWQTVLVKSPKLSLTGLMPTTTYEWNLKTICKKSPLVASAISETKTFVTQQKLDNGLNEVDAFSINVFPVPASNLLNINLDHAGEATFIEIRNMVGQLMQTLQPNDDETFNVAVDVSAWPRGIYLVEVKGDNLHETRKVIVD